jgi:hypothetical protein
MALGVMRCPLVMGPIMVAAFDPGRRDLLARYINSSETAVVSTAYSAAIVGGDLSSRTY